MTYQIGAIVNTPKGTGKIIEVDGKSLLVRIPPLGVGKMIFICADEVILNNQAEQGDKSPSVIEGQRAG